MTGRLVAIRGAMEVGVLRCATCKHWRPFWPGDGSEGGACERADGSPEALMCAADGSVMTRASFGCVMWEGKDGD